jgi:2'-5' RNA ligase
LPRLFTCFRAPAAEEDRLATRIAAVAPAAEALVADLRWTPRANWHVTLCFHGEDEVADRWSAIAPKLTGLPAPTLRLAGAGTFGGVLWIGVRPAGSRDANALADLAEAAGADRAEYTAHLTVARWRSRGRIDTRSLTSLFADYTGEWFVPGEVALMRSEPGPRGPNYHLEQCTTLTAAP